MRPSHVQLLKNSSFFSELADQDLERIAALTKLRSYRQKEVVVQQGDPAGDMALIVSGHLKVVSSDPEGRDAALNIMRPGEVFGEVSLFDGEPRSAKIVALEPCECLILPRDAFLSFLTQSPAIAVKLLSVMARRLRKLTERAEDIAFLKVSARLAKRVASLATEFGKPQDDGWRVSFKLSQQEIGDLIGATRESANKHIKLWEARGLVSQQGGHLIVHDLDGLRALESEAG